MDGAGFVSRWRLDFSAVVQNGPGAHSASYTMGTWSFPGVKRPGPGVDQQPPHIAEVKEIVELYLCSPSGPSWPVMERTVTTTRSLSLARYYCYPLKFRQILKFAIPVV